jgi:hypothetical protein
MQSLLRISGWREVQFLCQDWCFRNFKKQISLHSMSGIEVSAPADRNANAKWLYLENRVGSLPQKYLNVMEHASNLIWQLIKFVLWLNFNCAEW